MMCGVKQHHDVGLIDLLIVAREQLAEDRHVDRRPGTRATPCVRLLRSRPASRFDSPSRSRSRVVTSRLPNDGMFDAGDDDVAFARAGDAVTSRRMSPSGVTRRRHVHSDADVLSIDTSSAG